MDPKIDNLILNRLVNSKIEKCVSLNKSKLYYFYDDKFGKSVRVIEIKNDEEDEYFKTIVSYGFYTSAQRKNIIFNLTVILRQL